jgi:hypothetical protein
VGERRSGDDVLPAHDAGRSLSTPFDMTSAAVVSSQASAATEFKQIRMTATNGYIRTGCGPARRLTGGEEPQHRSRSYRTGTDASSGERRDVVECWR